MKTFQLATLFVITVLFASCASTDGVKTNAWGYNNNPNRQQSQEVEESEIQNTQRINNDMWQNPMVVSGFDDFYYSSMMFNAPPRFVPVMVPWWESSRYWHYNSGRHFMFQCDPMLVYWDWYSPYFVTNPFWGGAFVPTRYAWGGFTTYNPPVTRTIVEPTRTQQVRDFGPNRGTTSNPNTTRQAPPTNDGWNNRSQNYSPSRTTTSSPTRTNERTNTDGWNTRTSTPTITPTSPTRTNPTTSPTRTQTTSPTRTQTTSPTRTFTRESSKPAPSRSTTSSPSRATSSPSRSTPSPKSTPSTSTKRTGR